MRVVKKIAEWRKIKADLQHERLTLGFVPTMGYLHEGHLSLVRHAKRHADVVVMSIFVNPLQFGENEDFSTYPRDEERDIRLAQEAGVDYLFIPELSEMYPQPTKTVVQISQITDVLCGASRPGHFDGVATVVSKLFHIIQPDVVCFGQKDAQQVAVIEQLVLDLNFPLRILVCPIIREEDGLAKSSRNVYLNAEERKQATVLHAALSIAWKAIREGERDTEQVKRLLREKISSAALADIDYIEVLRYPSLADSSRFEGKMIIALAVRFGKTRLIDNVIVDVTDQEAELCFEL